MLEKLLALGGVATSMGLFAEAASSVDPSNAWSNYTALGVLASTLLFIVMKMLPDIHQKFENSSKNAAEASVQQTKAFAESVEKIQVKFSDTLDRIHDRGTQAVATQTDAITKLRENCAAACAEKRQG
jgi:uncharacterized membrane protein YhiD involved in acid resistance